MLFDFFGDRIFGRTCEEAVQVSSTRHMYTSSADSEGLSKK